MGDWSQTNKQITIRTTCPGYFIDLWLLEGSKQGLGVWLSRYITIITENDKRNDGSDTELQLLQRQPHNPLKSRSKKTQLAAVSPPTRMRGRRRMFSHTLSKP